jgi:hypothetical protein
MWVAFVVGRLDGERYAGELYELGVKDGSGSGRTLAEGMGEVLFGHLTPMATAEYAVLADAVRTIQARRIEASGLVTRQEAEEIEAVCTEYDAFEAAARTGREEELRLRGMAHRVGRA